MAAACGNSSRPAPVEKKAPPAPPAKITVFSRAGSADWYSADAAHRLLWHVAWKDADLNTVGYAPTVGAMQGVTGQIDAGDEEKTFTAAKAVADKAANTLTLTGGVSVSYPKNDAKMKCDKLIYDANTKVFDAKGNVTVSGKNAAIVGVKEAMADSKFTRIASPDMFQEKK